jgi:hypothetical protein
MALNHLSGIFSRPNSEWINIRGDRDTKYAEFFSTVPWLALIPAVAFFVGVTQVGWQLSSGGTIAYLTPGSAFTLCLLSYISALIGVWCFGEMINWMQKTYSDELADARMGMALAVYATAPLFVAGVAGLWPNLWFNVAAMWVAGIYSVYLIYRGMPILMDIPKERAFMYSTSVITVALVMLVSLRAGTAVLWSLGFGPEYLTQ